MNTKEIIIKTAKKQEFRNITEQLKVLLKSAQIKNGMAVITTQHTTAGLTINENADINVTGDIGNFLNETIPVTNKFKHIEGNSDAHIKSSLFGVSLTVIIEDGKFLLGVWQGIYFCEFDGPRERKIKVKFIAG
ncbi:MAG: secondary thiamine-phosphate synthase enzyme YjbQ [Candidatus Omnitrophica bacterium]|nr:secondary thiamine-phosphate synthase enzyme YjbQ [Candidatus Omnitrophota bacterium]